MKKLAITLAAALMLVATGCGNSTNPIVTYVARANSDSVPHLYTLIEGTGQSTAVNIPIPSTAYYVSSSSDATAVTYCRGGETTFDIFLMGTDGVEKQLTTNADACESVFSPDAKTIAYISCQTGDCLPYTMNVDGTNQKALYTPAAGTLEMFYPEFSADGKSVVFYGENATGFAARQQHPIGQAPSWFADRKFPARSRAGFGSPASSSGWYVMGLSDAAPTQTYATTDWPGPAVFSGDGKKLLLTMFDGAQYNVYSVNLDGTGLAELTTSTDTESISPVPYKDLILFNRHNTTTSSWDIYAMDQSGGNQTLVHTTADTWETLIDSYWGIGL